MEYLYISALSSERLIRRIHEHTGKNPGYAVQKFSRLLVKGILANDVKIRVLSAIPVTPRSWKKRWWACARETEDGVEYNYLCFLNFPFFRQIFLIINTFFYVLFWGLRNRENRGIICDVLNVSICMSSLCAARLIGIKCVGVVTDLPALMLRDGKKRSAWYRFADCITNGYLARFTHYVFLTEQMNRVVNKYRRPYIVMEGLADARMASRTVSVENGNARKVLMYAGGLHERYGLKMLVEAFARLNDPDWSLVIYGSGPFVDELTYYTRKYENIVYKGVVPNEEVVEAEVRANLLVNPRPTFEEFSKYSFPSKNIEYMVSGTPLLTTRLPGMPIEYLDYVYLFAEETVAGFQNTLRTVLHLSDEELSEKGRDARDFILTKKTNIVQAGRIIDFMNKNR